MVSLSQRPLNLGARPSGWAWPPQVGGSYNMIRFLFQILFTETTLRRSRGVDHAASLSAWSSVAGALGMRH